MMCGWAETVCYLLSSPPILRERRRAAKLKKSWRMQVTRTKRKHSTLIQALLLEPMTLLSNCSVFARLCLLTTVDPWHQKHLKHWCSSRPIWRKGCGMTLIGQALSSDSQRRKKPSARRKGRKNGTSWWQRRQRWLKRRWAMFILPTLQTFVALQWRSCMSMFLLDPVRTSRLCRCVVVEERIHYALQFEIHSYSLILTTKQHINLIELV